MRRRAWARANFRGGLTAGESTRHAIDASRDWLVQKTVVRFPVSHLAGQNSMIVRRL